MTAMPLALDAQAPPQEVLPGTCATTLWGTRSSTDGDRLAASRTDRDLVVRAVVDGFDPRTTIVGQVLQP